MSGPTKADLERRIQQLERELEIAHEQVSDLIDGAEWDQSVIKITGEANNATIKKACSLSDTVQVQAHEVKTLADKNKRYRKGSETKQEKDKEKSDYCTIQYEQYLADGIRQDIARRKANEATAEKFGKGLERSALYIHCPVPDASK